MKNFDRFKEKLKKDLLKKQQKVKKTIQVKKSTKVKKIKLIIDNAAKYSINTATLNLEK